LHFSNYTEREPSLNHRDDTHKSIPHISTLQQRTGDHAKEFQQKHKSQVIIILRELTTAFLDVHPG